MHGAVDGRIVRGSRPDRKGVAWLILHVRIGVRMRHGRRALCLWPLVLVGGHGVMMH